MMRKWNDPSNLFPLWDQVEQGLDRLRAMCQYISREDATCPPSLESLTHEERQALRQIGNLAEGLHKAWYALAPGFSIGYTRWNILFPRQDEDLLTEAKRHHTDACLDNHEESACLVIKFAKELMQARLREAQ